MCVVVWRSAFLIAVPGAFLAVSPAGAQTAGAPTAPPALQQLTGSVTTTIAHDSRVRHRTRVAAGGSDTAEVCDVSFVTDSGDDDNGGGTVDTEENCEEIEIPAGGQSRTVLANIQDWQANILAKFDHRLNFDSRGDAWRTLVEINQAWQAAATDQDTRVLKVRTGPSIAIPDWKTKLDLAAAYQNNRFNHANTLDVFSPFASVEVKPFAGMRVSGTYTYEFRHATPVALMGNAHTGDIQVRWDVTKLDRLTIRSLLRGQTTRSGFSGFDSAEFRLTYRRGFTFFGATGWYGEIEPRLRFVDFAAPSNNANDNGLTRHDRVRSMVLTLGRDFNPSWTLFGSYIYGYTDSNLIRFRKDDNRFLTSLVRNF